MTLYTGVELFPDRHQYPDYSISGYPVNITTTISQIYTISSISNKSYNLELSTSGGIA